MLQRKELLQGPEGERHASYRILRGVKNRFGSTNEIGVFEMQETGLKEVPNPSEFMLAGMPEGASGSVVTCSIEGTRPILLEIQALVCRTNFGMPRRTAAGIDYNRVNLLMAVLEKRLGYQLSECDAYVNVTGGIKMNEPSMDLGIVMALISSYRDLPIPEKTLMFGEIGLTGEVRGVSKAQQRVAEAKRLGYKNCIMPRANADSVKGINGINIIAVSNIREAVDVLFIKNNKDLISDFDAAIQMGLDYVHTHSDLEVAQVILKQFPDTSLNDLEKVIERYRAIDAWPKTTNFSKKSFEHLQNIMIENEVLEHKVPYNKLIYEEK